MRHSDQRDIVYQVVSSSCDHPNVETILERSKKLMPSINMATVYRNLNVLVNQNKIIRLTLTSGDRFDKTLYPHPHFYCKCCGNVTDVDHDAVSDQGRQGRPGTQPYGLRSLWPGRKSAGIAALVHLLDNDFISAPSFI